MKKTLILLASCFVAVAGAQAAPGHGKSQGQNYGTVHGKTFHGAKRYGHGNRFKAVLIRRSAANLARITRQAWRDGRLTRFERWRIRAAEQRHRQLVRRLRRS